MKKSRLLSILALLLVAVSGAMAQTETLLTTITATAKEQASYSTANVATISFSYTAYGSSAYIANWGWWGYGWSATVTPAEGYTITKCIFYDDANRTATDSEAPFVVETTEEDKTPKVNGKPILADTSKGIKKIEVYGYASVSTDVVINEANFPDENFRSFLLEQSYGTDGVLTDAEIAAVTIMDVSFSDIVSLKGIEYFTALQELNCNSNQLTTLDLTNNTALQALHCAGNKLTELNLKQNTALTNLNCYSNQLTALDLTQNTELTNLNCSVNQIKGTAMDALIASLPKNTDEETNFYLYVIDGTNNGELNEMTAAQATAVKAKGWTAYAYDGEDWKEYTGPAAYTASVNIEQLVLDEGLTYDIKTKFDESNIAYANLNALDGLNDLEDKPLRNVAFLGLKLKTQGAFIKVMVKKGSTLNVKLGCVNDPVNVTINGTAQEPIAANPSGNNYKTNYTYSYTADDADAEITFTTTTAKTVVFKQIMVDEKIADVTLPAPTAYLITVADGIKNGTVTVNWADKKYRTPVDAEVTVTATPATGYELDAISVKGAKSNQVYEVTDGKFTMPAEEVTVSATFKQITGINNVNGNGNVNQNAKVIKGGKLYIIKDGKEYTAAGAAIE